MLRFVKGGDDRQFFWEVEVLGSCVVERQGRVGTMGEDSTGICRSRRIARQREKKLIAQKLQDGYREGEIASGSSEALWSGQNSGSCVRLRTWNSERDVWSYVELDTSESFFQVREKGRDEKWNVRSESCTDAAAARGRLQERYRSDLRSKATETTFRCLSEGCESDHLAYILALEEGLRTEDAIEHAEVALRLHPGNLALVECCHRLRLISVRSYGESETADLDRLSREILRHTANGTDFSTGEKARKAYVRSQSAMAWMIIMEGDVDRWPEAIAHFDRGLLVIEAEFWRKERNALANCMDLLGRIRSGDQSAVELVISDLIRKPKESQWDHLFNSRYFVEHIKKGVFLSPVPDPSRVGYALGETAHVHFPAFGRFGKVATLLTICASGCRIREQDLQHSFSSMVRTNDLRSVLEFSSRRIPCACSMDGGIPSFVSVALEYSCCELLEQAVQAGVLSPSAHTRQGFSLLHLAVADYRQDIAVMLIDFGWDPQAQTDTGKTPLHLVESTEIAKALLAAGADPTVLDHEGRSPLDMAEKNNARGVAALLRKAVKKSTKKPPMAVAVRSEENVSVFDLRRAIADVQADELTGLLDAELSDEETIPLEEFIKEGLESTVLAFPGLAEVLQRLALPPTDTVGSSGRLVIGDITIEGDLEVDEWLVVLGNLTVKGVFSDSDTTSRSLVTGKVIAAAIVTSGDMVLLGGAEAGLIYGHYNDGTLSIDELAKTPVFLCDDHLSFVTTEGAVVDLPSDEFEEDHPQLKRYLIPEVMPEGSFSLEEALAVIQKGSPIVKSRRVKN